MNLLNFCRYKCTLTKLPVVSLTSEQYHIKDFFQKDPRTLIFLHGFLGSKKNYRTIGRHLSRKGFLTMGLDMRNHGDSVNAFPFDYSTMVNDLEHYIKQNGLKNVVLIGHSMGAKIAMLTALRNPRLVNSLVVVDNTPDYTPLDANFYENVKMLARLEQTKFPENVNQKELFELLREKMKSIDPPTQNFLLSGFKRFSNGHVEFNSPNECFEEYKVIDEVSKWPSVDTVEPFTNPVLVIKSKTSGFIKSHQPFDKYFTNYNLIEMDAGHYIITEKGKEFLQYLERFLNQNNASPHPNATCKQ